MGKKYMTYKILPFSAEPKFPIKLESLRNKANLLKVEKIASIVLDHPKFIEWSGCSHHSAHHYGTAGLQYHTWEVAALCELNTAYFINQGKNIDNKILFLSALFHDFGKIWDYDRETNFQSKYIDFVHTAGGLDPADQWQGTSHKRNLHHISRSGIEWSKAVDKTDSCKDIEDEVLHCILSHHGQRAWGSPVAPKSIEAWILHLCDGLSARADDYKTLDLISVK